MAEQPYRKYTPWALADAARVCLTYGTEFDRAEASESDLLQILNAYSQFADPVVGIYRIGRARRSPQTLS